jgi:hypothetical protein
MFIKYSLNKSVLQKNLFFIVFFFNFNAWFLRDWRRSKFFFHTEQSDKNDARVNHPCVRLLLRKVYSCVIRWSSLTLE